MKVDLFPQSRPPEALPCQLPGYSCLPKEIRTPELSRLWFCAVYLPTGDIWCQTVFFSSKKEAIEAAESAAQKHLDWFGFIEQNEHLLYP